MNNKKMRQVNLIQI